MDAQAAPDDDPEERRPEHDSEDDQAELEAAQPEEHGGSLQRRRSRARRSWATRQTESHDREGGDKRRLPATCPTGKKIELSAVSSDLRSWVAAGPARSGTS